jgi:hypothetical protein
MKASSLRFVWMPAALGAVLFACGETPPPASPDDSGELPLKVSTAKPAELPPPAEPTPTAAPTATAAASAAPTAPAAAQNEDSRPPVLKMDPKEISDTFGVSPGAKLELGPDDEKAVLRIPENSFTTGVNVTFKIDPKAKAAGGLIGKIYKLTSMVPPSGTPEKVSTAGRPFVLQLPAGNKKDANLAIGEVTPAKINWRVIAPVKIDDATNIATFELTELGDLYIHVTSRPVTAPPK